MKMIVLGLLALVFVTASVEASRFDESFDINDPLKNYPGLRKKN
ncbi:MAG: hypothetical protein ACSNEK_00240 [Parachlamydiaceae bacterium]